MKSSGESSTPVRTSWSAARDRLLAASAGTEPRDMQFWASRKRATDFIRSIGRELSIESNKMPSVSVGECGVCRHRCLRLGINPGEFTRKPEKVGFGELYSVEAISENGGWIKIVTRAGLMGWIESRSHFNISAGEHKVLSALKPTSTLNFLINALATGGAELQLRTFSVP